MSVFGVFLVHIFPHLHWIRRYIFKNELLNQVKGLFILTFKLSKTRWKRLLRRVETAIVSVWLKIWCKTLTIENLVSDILPTLQIYQNRHFMISCIPIFTTSLNSSVDYGKASVCNTVWYQWLTNGENFLIQLINPMPFSKIFQGI